MSKNTGLSKSTSKFFLGFKIYMAILLLVVFGILLFLWISLSRYQNKTEKNASTVEIADESETGKIDEMDAQSYFVSYINNMTAMDWAQVWYSKHPDKFDSENDVESFVQNKIMDANYSFYKHPDSSSDHPKYLLAEDENAIAQFELNYNQNEWSIDDASIMLGADNVFEAIVPSDSIVYLNEREVPGEFFEKEYEKVSISDYDENLTNPVTFDKCKVDELISYPQDRVAGGDGNNCELSEDGHYYKVLNNGSESEYKNRADDFIKSLLNYYAKGKENAEGNMHSVMGHVASGSAAYKIINESYSGIIWRPADYSVSYTTELSNVYILADNAYCVDVSYFANSTNENSDAGDGIYRVFFVDLGKGFNIVQFAGIK